VDVDINPTTQVIYCGPDTSNLLMECSRDQLSDRPFGDGTPGVGWLPREEVPADHGPGGVPHR